MSKRCAALAFVPAALAAPASGGTYPGRTMRIADVASKSPPDGYTPPVVKGIRIAP